MQMFRWLKRASNGPVVAQIASTPETDGQPLDERVAPESVHVLMQTAMRHYSEGEYETAIQTFERVLHSDPRHLAALYQIANAWQAQEKFADALVACDHALSRLPDQQDLLMLRSVVAGRAKNPEASLATLEHLRSINPKFPNLDCTIGEQLCLLGRGREAIEAFDRAIIADPNELSRKSMRLFFLNFFGLLDRQQLFQAHREWGELIDNGFAVLRKPLQNTTERDRPIKIGLVSGDLRNHAVAHFIEGYLREHNRANFPIHCFDVSVSAEDQVTARLRPLVEDWHRVGALGDEELADEIRRHQIDVLVDLAGHSAPNRLLVFAQKPAPVQVAWFGYMNTTGLTSIDYRLTDEGHDPSGDSQQYYTEKLFHIPSLACFTPDARSPAVAPSPFVVNGHVTFISANQWTKVTENVKDLWAEILCDDSRPHLKIIAQSAASESFREAATSEFTRRGVRPEQIDFEPFMDKPDFLAYFANADVALDPFPYGGGTTTLHTIWMGVPIIAMQGDTELGRATPGMLRGFGLADFVADSPGDYRDKAIALARDPSRLIEIRANLRQRMADSTALDATGLARNVENSFRTMWHTYCANHKTARE
jgi:protein O-GlcNAc transferase